ncbi:HNH endonuclease signature motif containing protein, partial [Priestia megaterium]
GWFYTRLNNNRMENEELFIILSYMVYKYEYTDAVVEDYLDIYPQKDRINARIKDKGDITKTLEAAIENDKVKNNFIKSLKTTEAFIKKIISLLVDDEPEHLDDYLKKELESLLYLGGKKGTVRRRTLQSFYLLWYLLKDVNISRIARNKLEMREEIIDIFSLVKSNPDINEDVSKLTKEFGNKSEKFILKFTPQKRSIQLNMDEKEYLLTKQSNICPICDTNIFISDDHEVDHITPLSLGGRDGITNLQITHKTCNRGKGNRIK